MPTTIVAAQIRVSAARDQFRKALALMREVDCAQDVYDFEDEHPFHEAADEAGEAFLEAAEEYTAARKALKDLRDRPPATPALEIVPAPSVQ